MTNDGPQVDSSPDDGQPSNNPSPEPGAPAEGAHDQGDLDSPEPSGVPSAGTGNGHREERRDRDVANDEPDDPQHLDQEDDELHFIDRIFAARNDAKKSHEKTPDFYDDPISKDCDLPVRLEYVKLTRRLEGGRCEFSIAGEKVWLSPALSALLELLIRDDGPSGDELVRFKSQNELTRALKITRHNLHMEIHRLRDYFAENMFLLGDPVDTGTRRGGGYRFKVLSKRNLARR